MEDEEENNTVQEETRKRTIPNYYRQITCLAMICKNPNSTD